MVFAVISCGSACDAFRPDDSITEVLPAFIKVTLGFAPDWPLELSRIVLVSSYLIGLKATQPAHTSFKRPLIRIYT